MKLKIEELEKNQVMVNQMELDEQSQRLEE